MSAEKATMNVIVDTGCANLSSVKFAVERLGFQVIITDDIETIKKAKKVILPGVGTAKHAMANIRAKGLVETLQNLTQPVLGFCLGMQLMCNSSLESSEGEKVECLGIIDTDIVPLNAKNNRLPHMGWNTLTSMTDHPVFNGINIGDYFYFVHSFAAPISEYTAAVCKYGSEFSAAITKNNFIGCQFHPERSSELGSKIIKNFLKLDSTEILTS
ncbi:MULTISPECIES: imidazole glycerol phosphate synthase subunit HisH [unclassified Colwellia]|uniref:imidazole glycerol phosphate synthase subunit HisH n=1 Tax=unclassified Colwellia TaxID=196834 RepID=UPI0015F37283|nr:MULTISPECIES: imidazole glycerol phosphate synthase subunit HisH [unclassified Colwellia]MBA6233012.1 imidazole glycerol phosphate synthase subunit HisH [Colwellia sp. MB02u-7]MBA6236690.1 imidazole glycerol phosphate synthase subunit HisH [Colwellia sp. MB02u-11]MBA6255882.1 imidazole glycerol phosphate synthase subunit HisH [Colwellia sp. MB3u-28]MBA6262024.1 imidazole glycerol phosphate synthase subunit HisH [Colwellia sp. MB3u-41]MBA6298992.1 imidazole glycerol phosphate synthase subuni